MEVKTKAIAQINGITILMVQNGDKRKTVDT